MYMQGLEIGGMKSKKKVFEEKKDTRASSD